MRSQILNILTGIALAAGMISASATGVSVATVPAGMISFTLVHGTTTFLSLPLTNTETYNSTVNTVSANTISVADAPAPFTKNLATPASPYFVKFLSGAEAGRVLLITSNTTSALTLDTTDNSPGAAVALNATAFSVQAGDSFEIFPGDTISSIFGSATAQNPLVVAGAPTLAQADAVSFINIAAVSPTTYYYNTTDGYWEKAGSAAKANANNTIIYPYSALIIYRQQSNPDATLIVTGRVTAVAAQTRMVGQNTVFSSTHFATDVKLSQLKFGANWVMGSDAFNADTLAVWNAVANRFDLYYQKPDTTWRKFPDSMTDQSNVSIAAGTVTAIDKQTAVTGAATFLQSPVPYSLN
jgi:uncharacterized protein (TIGR02597 family)